MQVLKKFISMIVTVLLGIMLLINVYQIYARFVLHQELPQLFGWSWAVVVSGSMEDAICVNDLIIVHYEDEYQKDDIITFENDGSYVTHRIIECTEEGFITKGDANNAPDSDIVQESDIVGKVVLSIPQFGKVLLVIQTPLGTAGLVAVGYLIFGGMVCSKGAELKDEDIQKRKRRED